MKQYTRDEFLGLLADTYYATTDLDEIVTKIDRWLARGDGAAVYRNNDLGHPEAGHVKIVSFGSPSAQLETGICAVCRRVTVKFEISGCCGGDVLLPERLPDNLPAGHINWRYGLEGTYRGETIST